MIGKMPSLRSTLSLIGSLFLYFDSSKAKIENVEKDLESPIQSPQKQEKNKNFSSINVY